MKKDIDIAGYKGDIYVRKVKDRYKAKDRYNVVISIPFLNKDSAESAFEEIVQEGK